MSEKEFTNEYCKYVFSDVEKKEIATEMAQKVSALQELEDDLKAVKSDFKGRIDRVTAEVNGAATKINTGSEMRQIECEVEYNYATKMVRSVRTDTFETVRERKMTSDEMQMDLTDG